MKNQKRHNLNYFSLILSVAVFIWTPLLHADLDLEACMLEESFSQVQVPNVVRSLENETSRIKNGLNSLALNLKSLIKNKFLMPNSEGNPNSNEFIDTTLGLLSTAGTARISKNPIDNLQAQLLLKIKTEIEKLNPKFNFTARLAFLPKGMCSEIDKLITHRNTLENIAPSAATTVKTQSEVMATISDLVSFQNFTAHVQDKNQFNFIGFHINLKYRTNFGVPTLTKAKTAPLSTESPYELGLSGGILIAMPENFTYKLEVPLQFPEWFVPNIIIKEMFFDKKPGDLSQKHFALLNFRNLLINENGLHIQKDEKSEPQSDLLGLNTLKFDLYFTDEVKVEYFFGSRNIFFEPTLDRPVRSLITQVLTEQCDTMIKIPPQSRNLWEKISAYRCNDQARIDIAINHLVLEMTPLRIMRHDTDPNPINTFFPKIRAPDFSLGEQGGIKIMARQHAPIDPMGAPREELFGFYLNGTKLATAGIDAVYNNLFGLAAANAAYIYSIYKILGDKYCQLANSEDAGLELDIPDLDPIPSVNCAGLKR